MNNYNDLIGKKFGKLTLLGFTRYSKCKYPYFRCQCDCGTFIETNLYRLTAKTRQLTECSNCQVAWNSPLWKGFGEISSSLWSGYKNGAKSRNLEFSVTMEEGWNKFLEQNRKCALTGIPLTLPYRRNDKTSSNISLDRIDSKLGYTNKNIQWILKGINKIKNNCNNEFFILLCNLVAKTNYRDEINLEKFNIDCMEHRPFKTCIGQNHWRAKTYTIQKQNGEILTIKGIGKFCRDNNLDSRKLNKLSKKNIFYEGVKIIN